VDPDIARGYETTVQNLAAELSKWLGDPAILTLSELAQKAMQAIEAAIEPTLAGDGELASIADWGAKYAGAIARIAGMLHLAEQGPDQGPRTPIAATTIQSAYRIGEYFKATTINAFAEMGTDRATADAVYLLGRIQQLCQDEVSERDIHVASRSRFKTKADLQPALERLIDHGYLIPLEKPESTGGRPASRRYEVIRP
jgi:hypothetical protein